MRKEHTVKWVYLDTVFKCDRCATVRESLNLETVHVCRCRDSGPVWQQVRRWRPNWTLILAVLLCGAIAYCVSGSHRIVSALRAVEAWLREGGAP